MYEIYIVRNKSSFTDVKAYKCPVRANEELELRLDQGIDAEMVWPDSDEALDAEMRLLDIAQETGLTGIVEALGRYSE